MIRLVFLGIIALFTALSAVYVIDETEAAIVTRLGEFRYTVHDPGLYFKSPFVDTVHMMDRRILGTDTPASEYLTLDKKRLVADPITRWRIVDPLKFFKTVRDEHSARKRLDDIVQSELRREIASHDFGEIIGNERDPLMAQVRDRVAQKATEYGISVRDVRIKRADLPQQVQESVYARMRAERDRVAKKYRSEGAEEAAKIRAETDKEQTIILAQAYETAQKLRGEGDAESTKVYAEAYGQDPEFYAFMRSLDTYERSIGKDSTLILSTGSELFRYFGSPGKQR
jgi:modulator of FtsH protease HflC